MLAYRIELIFPETRTALPTSIEKLPVIVDVSLQFTLRQKSKSTTEGEEL